VVKHNFQAAASAIFFLKVR